MLEESVGSIPSLWATVNSWFTPTVLFIFLNLMIGIIALSSSFSKPNHNEEEEDNPEQVREIPRNLDRSPSVLQRLKSISSYSHRSPPVATHYNDHSYDYAPLQEKQYDNGDEKPKSFFARSPSNVLRTLKSLALYTSNLSPETVAPSPPTADSNHHFQGHLIRGARLSFGEALEDEGAGENVGAGDDGEGQKDVDEPNRSEEQSSLDEIYSQLKGNQVGMSKSDRKLLSGEVPMKLSKNMKKSASAKLAFAYFEEDDTVERFPPATAREYKEKVSDDEEEDEGEVDAKADDFINRFKQQLHLQRLESIASYKEMVNRGNNK
ncbi:hypothetical protein SAY86_011579 [Trapa natans]|uniref:DUF4408 domain-containing protein n=1 Tax=Trapa natans TaxID=22666 RepID=A0AAN7LZH8_TRANT|nr:hypothetical protein SAY86_011579 [Trapa natans]